MRATELRQILDDVIAEHGDTGLNVFVHDTRPGMCAVESAHFLADDHESSGVRMVRIDLLGADR